MVSQVRDRSRTSFRLAGFFAALAIALLLTAAGAESPLLAQEGTQPQDQKPSASNKEDRPTVEPPALNDKEAATDQLIVKFKKDAGSSSRAEARSAAGLEKKKDLDLIDAEVDKVKGQSLERAIEALERRSDVEYAEVDYINYPSGYADEPQFGHLWGLNNTGQTINGISGTADMDINGKEASTVTQGDQNLLVAVIDDGVDFTHPDLKDRAWKNPGESGSGKETNGVDDDANGKVDDVNGWDFVYEDNTVHDPGGDAHGTHVSGTLAASVNGEGIVGVAPNIQIMALKVLGPNGGPNSDAIDALGYAKSKGAKISNNSWGCQSDGYYCNYSQALYDAINSSGSLFVTGAGDAGYNNDDYWSFYPASYDLSNILSVGAVDNQGKLASFSNYGATSVDILAPGVSILSSVPGIPGDAATLSSVGSSGKALTAGFGAEEIGESAKRTSFFKKAFTAVDRGSQQVVLVDDDADDLGFADVGPSVSTAIQGATGSAPQLIDVPYGSDGPDLSKLSGKTVVWATGRAFLSKSDEDCVYYEWNWAPCPGYGYYNGYYITNTTLTSTDQKTLKDFLDGGGKLVITGMDALFLIEGSPLVASTLNLDVTSRVGGETFSGASGTAFDGEAYTFNSSTANAPNHALVVPATSAAVIQGSYPGIPPTWKSKDGTSMAAPHATGAAALAASVEPALLGNPGGLKNRIMNGKPLVAAAGKTVSGDMVDALKAAQPPDDTTAPTVSSVTPPDPTDGKDVDTNTKVVATFSEEMDAASVTDPANFTLRNGGCNTPATLSYDSATKKATLVPSAPLDTASTYSVTVSGAWDLAGNQLDQDPNTSGEQPNTSSFTTAGSPPPNVWTWGRNENGTLGDCTTTQRTTPEQVGGLKGVTDVAAGCDHSLALKDDGTVWAWGWNGHGQLGNGTSDLDAHTSPVKVSGLSGVKDVSSGCSHSLAVKDDGTVWAWGLGGNGQLGDGTATKRTSPVKVSGLSGVTDVAGGWHHSLAVKDDGAAWAWGSNSDSQLGVDYTTTIFRKTPGKVGGISSVVGVSGGGEHSLALKDDGTVWTWGWWHSGNDGGLDDCCSTNNKIPVKVSGLSGITYVVAGMRDAPYHNLAVSSDRPLPALPADSQAPSPPAIDSPANNTFTNDSTPEFSGTNSSDSTKVTIYDGQTELGEATIGSSGTSWSFTPTAALSEEPHSITAKAEDAAGNTSAASTSVAVTVDKTAPTVTESSLSPASGVTNVARNTNVTGTFSEKMDPATPTNSTVTLVKSGTTTLISATVSYNDSTKTVTLKPSSNLAARTKYTVKMSGGVKDLAGNALAPYTWSFTTAR